MGETLSDALQEFHLLIEIDSPDFKFDAVEALFQLLLHPLQHLFIVAHPYESVDGNTHFPARESSIEEKRSSISLFAVYIEHCRFQTEQHRRIVAQFFIRYLARLFHLVAEVS